MHSRTGAIAHFENETDAKRAHFDVPLTAGQVNELALMTRKQRREWARARANQAARELERLQRRVTELEAENARLRGAAGE